MKTRFCIFSLFLLALASCHGPFGTRSNASSDAVVSPEPQSPQRSQLLAIDSLMWQQPDSALALLLPWFDTVDSSQAFDNHYAQLLLAELLYKNDYAQTNRDELLQAVEYYDSIMAGTGWASTRGVSLRDIFISARSHYINGVGHYETDSVLDACQEMHQCLLYLLDVEDVQIAHLLFCDYSTVKKRSRKLKTAFKIEKELRLFIKDLVL